MSEHRPPKPPGRDVHWVDGRWVQVTKAELDLREVRRVQARRTELVEELLASMADSIDLMGEMSRMHVLPDGRRYKLTISPG